MKRRSFWPALAVFLFASGVQAFELMPMLGAPGTQKTMLHYGASYAPKVHSDSGPNDTRVHEEQFQLTAPIFQNTHSLWTTSIESSWLDTETNVVLPNSNASVPSEFWNLKGALSYAQRDDEEHLWTGTVSFGSASDKPFSKADVLIVNATVGYGFSDPPSSKWFFLLNYSNNRPLLNNIPLPGFAYSYVPSKAFQATVGVPFASVRWRPIEKMSLSFFTLAPWTVQARAGYAAWGPVETFVSFDFSQELFLRAGRDDPKARFFYDKKIASAGIKSPIATWLMGELKGGYAFGRSFFEGQRYTSPIGGKVNLGNTWQASLALDAFF